MNLAHYEKKFYRLFRHCQLFMKGHIVLKGLKNVKGRKEKENNKAHELKAQPLKYFIFGSSPCVNRKLLTHILKMYTPTNPLKTFSG